ncbi:MAG: phosphoribosylglycinamide formyltransferase [Actinobacteria bacterium HGW-Actinobacteria-9]|nr:MAG: phosphoribosylglycinamide formyltransferase [Actinobacteria bacterium HGW-Actinobacteria-9]
MRLGVLISGSGTNLQAIMDACDDGSLTAKVAVVISSHDGAMGLERARRAGIPDVWIDRAEYDRASKYNEAIRDALLRHGVGMVVMAGYMRLLGHEVLEAFPDRVVNIHPALLPAFPGANGIRDAFEHGVKVTGVTVHFANENFDDGPIIAQQPVLIDEDDTLATLEAKIHDVEHRLYPAALQLLAMRRVEIDGRRTRILPPIPVIGE